MSDLLKDQTIHYIVKDYRRMFFQQQQLVDTCKDLQKKMEKRDKEISNLKARLAKNPSNANIVNEMVSVALGHFSAMGARAEKGQQLLNELMKLLKSPDLKKEE